MDGSIIILRDKPQVNPEAYFSRKKEYGINLQAVCDWNRRFIYVSMGHPAAAHDSTAFKDSRLYKNRSSYFHNHEYLLADKAYSLEKHIIVPYKDLHAQVPSEAAFNYQLSIPHVKIEHAFGVLKARFPSLRSLPVRIGLDQQQGHNRVMMWISTCLVLHNWLHSIQEEEDWLDEFLSPHDNQIQVQRAENERVNEQANAEVRAGRIRREELVNKVKEIVGAGVPAS